MLVRRLHAALAFLAVVFSSAAIQAQTSYITGTISDAASETPLSNVTIELRQQANMLIAASASTNAAGQYRLNNVQPGTYTLRFTRVGYAPVTTEPFTVSPGVPTIRSMRMSASVMTLERVVVGASRVPEKVLDAPATVTVIESATIEERPSRTIADHLRAIPGVDATEGGLVQSNIVARGFNNAFSGAMLMLIDNRFASVPSLRVNVPVLFTSTLEDVDHIEAILGPAAALYGSNSANGVLAIFTKSPFDSKGATLSLEAGEHGILKGGIRAAATLGSKVGVKFSAERLVGNDFEYTDPNEPAAVPRPPQPGQQRVVTPVQRNFDVERSARELRVDFRASSDMEIIASYGAATAGSALELTGSNGTAQVRDWTYSHAQLRARYKGLFVQAFANFSDAGNSDSLDNRGTFLLRTGNPIVDRSRTTAFQVQQRWDVTENQRLVFGFDYVDTDPRTYGTINGRNEDEDKINENGLYVHSLTRLTPKFDIVAAIRSDYQSVVDERSLSPRLGVVFKPTETQNIRLTYNRASFTPATFSFYIDLAVQQLDPSRPQLPYFVRALGNNGGFAYRRDCTDAVQSLCMKTPFSQTPGTFVNAGGTDLWRAGMAAAGATIEAALTQRLGNAQQAAAVVNFLRGLTPTDAQVGSRLQVAVPGTGFVPFNSTRSDIADLDPEVYDVLELGYKRALGARGSLMADVWYQKRKKFTGPALNVTPNVFVTSEPLAAYLTTQLTPVLGSQAAAAEAAGLIAPSLAQIPLGTVVPDHPLATTPDILFSYFQVEKDVNLFGADVALEVPLGELWSLGATYSWVSEDYFPDVFATGVEPLSLNAPDNKGSVTLGFDSEEHGLKAFLRGRYMNAFTVSSGVYQGRVPVNAMMDVGASYQIPWKADLLLSLLVTNVLNNERPTFIGVPDIGRIAVAKLQVKL